MIYKFIVTAFVIMLFCGCRVNNPVKDHVDDESYGLLTKVQTFDKYYGGAVGYAGAVPKEWKVFQKYRKSLSEYEVEYIVNNYSGIAKMYTYQAGVINGYSIVDTLLQIHKNDKTEVSMFVGCLIMPQTVGDFIVNTRTFPPKMSSLNPLSKKIINQINTDLLLSGNRTSQSRSYLLIAYNDGLKKEENEILRTQFDNGDYETIIQIAKSRNENDLSRINSVLKIDSMKYHGLLAISYYPDQIFRAIIFDQYEKVFQKDGGYDYPVIRSLYHAYINYLDDEQITKSIERINGIKGEFKRNLHKENMFQSIMMSSIREKDKLIEMLDFNDEFGEAQDYIERKIKN